LYESRWLIDVPSQQEMKGLTTKRFNEVYYALIFATLEWIESQYYYCLKVIQIRKLIYVTALLIISLDTA
jgi:hypothetical protein